MTILTIWILIIAVAFQMYVMARLRRVMALQSATILKQMDTISKLQAAVNGHLR